MALYGPVMAARPRAGRLFPAALVGFVWTLPSLLAIQLMNLHFGWWQFHAQDGVISRDAAGSLSGVGCPVGCPSDSRFSANQRYRCFLGIDLLLMPLCEPVVELGRQWLV